MCRSKKFKLTEEQELEIIERYMDGESIRKIAEHYPVGRTSIGYVLSRHNVKTKGTGNSYGYANKKYTLNEDFFEDIDTEEKAYWLGFICADGHVSDDGVVIGLNKRDKKHLEKFLKAVNSNSNIKDREETNSVYVNIYSKKMVEDLRNLGLYKQKSKTLKFPAINHNLHKHFIRGLFDGDGCLTKGRIDFSGTIDVVNSIKHILIKLFNLRDAKVMIRGSNFAVVGWNKGRQEVLDYMYIDSTIYLDRKYERYINGFHKSYK